MIVRRYDVAAVESALSVPLVLEKLGFHLNEKQHRTRRIACPIHRGRNETTFAWSKDGRQWYCFGPCQRGGFPIRLIMEIEGIDFHEALALGASIAGIERLPPRPQPPVGAEQPVPAGDPNEPAALEAANRHFWERLDAHNSDGEAYLASRGLAGVCHPDVVRFNDRGAVCVPIRAIDDGRIVNVARRQIDGSQPKVLVNRGTTFGTFGNARHLDDTHGPVVMVEGVADYLTALVRLDQYLPLGVNGAGNLPKVVRVLAPQVAERGFLFVPHDDGPEGAAMRALEAACGEAAKAGIPRERLLVLNLGGAKDLNEWHCGRRVA